MLLEHVFESFLFTGLDHDGIYRISGNLAQIQKLRCQVDQGKKTKLIYSMLILWYEHGQCIVNAIPKHTA